MEMDCWQAAEARKDAKMKKATRLVRFTTVGELIKNLLKNEGYEIVELDAIVQDYKIAYKAHVLKKDGTN